MRTLALFVLACTIGAAYGRELLQAAPAASYNTLAQAVAAANASAPNLSILLAAVKAANVSGALGPNTTWTILAPTNQAFTSRLNESLGITPQQLLQPANKKTLVEVLSYHVIPSGAVYSSNLTNGQEVPTALAGADPLTVAINNRTVTFEGAENNATVTVANIRAGRSVIHVINDVLLPAGVGNSSNTTAEGESTAPGAAGSRDVAAGSAVGGGSTSAPAPAAAKGAAGAAQVPAVLLASMLLIGMLF
nr:CvacAstaP1 [Scenedesmus vacuolatus]